ncbi:amino acid oxidase [Actinoalloteichus sp. AHMU CJ021]|uniref:flavin monoamine oxidase family protein n=1 Tax=Actinoalloteichus sp. AHMU CJ021 TaxID=2072503 RepID=UPI000CA024F7|nr:amino acid oxidase [Actinoalloteichus sp. AHMU CJ021]
MRSEVTRRDLLRTIGATGGAGVLFETMTALGLAPDHADRHGPDFHPPRRAEVAGDDMPTVLVIGAGVAGLTAAYELGKAGYDCRVLEARHRSGGRNLTVRGGDEERDLDGRTHRAEFADGQYMNAGPGRIAQSMVTLDYCRELGVPVEPFANQNANAYVHRENGAGRGTAVRFRTAKADVYGYVAELLAKATDQGALDDVLTAEDRERVLSFLEGFGAIGGRADGWAYRGGSRRGYAEEPGAGERPGVVLGPPPTLSEVFASQVGRAFSFEFGVDQAMMMFQPVGGMDAIVTALERAVGVHRVTHHAEVRALTTGADGVRVVYRDARGRDQVATADYCVATLPPRLLARLDHNLGPEVSAALAQPRPTASGKIGLEYQGRWWEQEERLYGGITQTDLDITQIWYPSHGHHEARGVLIGYYVSGQRAVEFGRLSPAERLSRAVRAGSRIHGARYRRGLTSSFSIAWERTPHIEEGWASWPSRSSGHYALLTRPAGRVHFAGDWLSYLVAWQAGAFLSARDAVTNLHQQARAT